MASLSTVVAALIAVLGTLSASFLAQRGTLRDKRQEFELARMQRQEDNELAAQKARLEQRRACYVALNIAARQFRVAILNLLHALQAEQVNEDVRAALEEARRQYLERHAEAQMIVPDEVLNAAGAVKGNLDNWYGMVKRLDRGTSEINETLDSTFEYRKRLWQSLGLLRTTMRIDLGVSDGESGTNQHEGTEAGRI